MSSNWSKYFSIIFFLSFGIFQAPGYGQSEPITVDLSQATPHPYYTFKSIDISDRVEVLQVPNGFSDVERARTASGWTSNVFKAALDREKTYWVRFDVVSEVIGHLTDRHQLDRTLARRAKKKD